MISPAEIYWERLQAVQAQNARIYRAAPIGDRWGGQTAKQFRFDPHRDLDRNLSIIAAYVGPEDTLLDVGGGAGRIGLPLALRCREVINIEPSPGMGAEFASSAFEAAITNAQLLASSLDEVDNPRGDIVFTADVTYFVGEIVGFIRQLEAAASHRVIITIWSEPPPNRRARLFEMIYGEEQKILPGYQELLAVMWDMGILPDVHVMPELPWWENQRPSTRDGAVQLILDDSVVRPDIRDRARWLIETNFDDLFAPSDVGFVPLWRSDMRELLITWDLED